MSTATATTRRVRWDEPAADRGWLYIDGTVRGFFLDYGPDHYRSPHRFCRDYEPCRECQPGNVLAVIGTTTTGPKPHRWFFTVGEAKLWVVNHSA